MTTSRHWPFSWHGLMPETDPAALTADEILRLQHLGALVRRAHTRSERSVHVDTVLLVVRQHREVGITWSSLARAVGVNASTLRRWRRRDRPVKGVLAGQDRAALGKASPGGRRHRDQSSASSISLLGDRFAVQSESANEIAVSASAMLSDTAAPGWPRRPATGIDHCHVALVGSPR